MHFIPAWYGASRPWYVADDAASQTAGGEPDDTVTRVRIFRQGDEPTRLIVLNYAPSLRRFLHGQDVFDVPYWSFFDHVQGVVDDYTRPLDFLELEWPDDASFFYNPFLVTVMRGESVYARVHLSREGTLQSIRFYGDGMPTVERIYDDRGFLSSVLMHSEDGQPATQYYLSPAGDVIVSEDLPTGRIDVVQNADDRFAQASYDGWEQLIAELLGAYLREHGEGTVVLALAEQHDDLVASLLTDQTLVLSWTAARPTRVSSALLARAGVVLSDFGTPGDSADPDQELDWAMLPTLSVYPLERRPTFGASANEADVYISLFADDITADELDFAIATMATQLVADERTRLLVCTFRSQDLDHLQRIRRVIAGYQNLDLAFLADDESALLGIDVGIAEGPEEKIQLAFVDREADLIRTLAKTRVLVDLGATVNRRLATEAVNAGVPQINRYEQELCTHPINGYAIRDDAELAAALEHYLSGLEHWNQSLVQCRVLEDLFSAPEVLGRWDLIKEEVTYAGAADRP
ncbi:accessory Sec system protein Asp1 [Microbacterium tumbae]